METYYDAFLRELGSDVRYLSPQHLLAKFLHWLDLKEMLTGPKRAGTQ